MKLRSFLAGATLLASLLAAQPAMAQIQPHRAEYSLRLGAALNAPRIGTAVQDIILDCTNWRIRRDLSVEIAFTPSFKIAIASRTEGEEARVGTAFDYRAVQVQNGAERETRGTVRRRDKDIHVEMATPEGPQQAILPSLTFMPVAAVGYLVDRLKAGASSFPLLMFGAEAGGAAFLLDVKELEPDAFQTTPPALKRVDVPGGRSWPLLIAVTRAGQQQDGKPLLSLRTRIFDSGVVDRLTIDAGPFTVAAYLQALEMHPVPRCPDR